MLVQADIAGFVDAIASHDIRLVAGLDAAGLAAAFTFGAPPRRPVLRIELDGPGGVERIVERAIAQLASAVLGLWPYLWGGEDFSQLRNDALSLAHLPIRLATLARRHPRLSQAWAGETLPRLLRGASPRLHAAASALEWAQLALAFAPDGLVVATPLGPPRDATPRIAALEWLARNGDVAVLVLAGAMPAASDATLDHILFGARQIGGDVDERSLADQGTTEAPAILALPETDGRPHPQSAAELKLYTLIQADADLRPLFAFNRTVPDLPLLHARADLIWAAGRLVVEIDGPEHRGAAKYRADRHRDYQLLRAGYRVLRMTNEDIADDAMLALEKIRDVVELTKREAR